MPALVSIVIVLSLFGSAACQRFQLSAATTKVPPFPDTVTQLGATMPQITLTSCISTASSANGPFCLTTGPPEIFYYNMQVVSRNTAQIIFRYTAAIEASYINIANGVGRPGSEVLFSRIRISVTARNNACRGKTFTVVHPYGTNTITEGTKGRFTEDIGVNGALGALLASSANVYPLVLPTTAPITAANGDTFIADPAVPVTFTGSPTGTNFVQIVGPAGCDVSGTRSSTATFTTATFAGQLGTPI